jgi:hypothetical protein
MRMEIMLLFLVIEGPDRIRTSQPVYDFKQIPMCKASWYSNDMFLS